MHSILKIVVSMFLLSSVVAIIYPFDPEDHGLVPSPRIGRRDLSMVRPEPLNTDQYPPTGVRRTGESPGMWSGPRLRRSLQSEEDDITVQTDNNYHSDLELMKPINEERVKRQTKST